MSSSQSFTGGLRTVGFNATWPFARLVLKDEGLTLRVFGFVQTRREWDGVVNVEQIVGGILGSPGVRIALIDGSKLVFWSFNPQRVLEAFRSYGVQIIESSKKPPKVWLGT
jgi:hypothetical protein